MNRSSQGLQRFTNVRDGRNLAASLGEFYLFKVRFGDCAPAQRVIIAFCRLGNRIGAFRVGFDTAVSDVSVFVSAVTDVPLQNVPPLHRAAASAVNRR